MGGWAQRIEHFLAHPVGSKLRVADCVTGVLVLLYTVAFSWIAVHRYETFQSTLDLGSGASMLYAVTRGWLPLWAPLGHEFSLLQYIFLPVEYVFPGPVSLLVLQTVLIGGAALPLYLLTLQVTNRTWIGVLVAGMYLVNPMVQALNWFDLHIEMLGLPFVFAFFYFYRLRRSGYAALFFTLALSASYLFAFGLAAWAILELLITWKNHHVGAKSGLSSEKLLTKYPSLQYSVILFSLSVGFCISGLLISDLVTSLLVPLTGNTPLGGASAGLSVTLVDFVVSPLQNYGLFASDLFFGSAQKLWYLVVIFGLFLFLPLLRPRLVVGALPWLIFAVTSTSAPFYTIPYFQYGALVVPFLFVAFVDALPDALLGKPPAWIIVALETLVFLPVFFSPVVGPYPYTYIAVAIVFVPLLPWLISPPHALQRFAGQRAGAKSDDRPSPRPISPKTLRFKLTASMGWDESTLARIGVGSVLILLVVSTTLPFLYFTPTGPLNSRTTIYELVPQSPRDELAQSMINLIPKSGSVLVQNHLYPHLWDYRYANVHDTTFGSASYILADLGPPSQPSPDYFAEITPPYPSIGQSVFQNLTLGSYGVFAEAQGLFLLERGYSDAPIMYQAESGAIDPCSLNYFPSSGVGCQGGALVQGSNSGSVSTVWYGPYILLQPGVYNVSYVIDIRNASSGYLFTVGVSGYYPGSTPFGLTLAQQQIVSTGGNFNGSRTINLTFSDVFPMYIQFGAGSESAGILLSLESLHYSEISPSAQSPVGSMLNLMSPGASYLVQPSLYGQVSWYGHASIVPSSLDRYILASVSSQDYYQSASSATTPLSTIVYQNLTDGAFGVLGEDGTVLLLEKGYTGAAIVLQSDSGEVPPCTLIVPEAANVVCQSQDLVQLSNPNGTATVWYGPYTTLVPGNYSAVFQLQLIGGSELSGHVAELGVVSFLQVNTSIVTVLSQRWINVSDFSPGPTETEFTFNFTIAYPALIQFPAGYEQPDFLLKLDGLAYAEHVML